MIKNTAPLAALFVLAGIASAAALGAAGRPATARDHKDSLQEELACYIENKMKEKRIVGLSASVIAGGRTILCEGFGYADRDAAVEMTEKTLLPIGSTTKLFTATAVMQLVERGLVDLDSPLSAYLPSFSIRRREGQEGPITVRQLLTHHSGLPSNLYADFQPDNPDPEAFRELPRLLAGETLARTPGSAFAYSNLGYALLGCVIEAVTGVPYTTYVERNILSPLGMKSSLTLPPAETDPRISLGYRGRREVQVYAIRDLPAGSMLSSAADMDLFMGMILNRGSSAGESVLSAAGLEQMISRQNAGVELDRDFAVGLGYWLIDPIGLDGERLASHGGDLPPFHSVLVTLPDAGIAVFLAANSSTARGTVITMASDIVRAVYGSVTGRAVRRRPPAARTTIDAATAASLAGLYAGPMGLLEIRSRKAALYLSLGRLPLRLVPRSDGTYTPELPLLRLLNIRPEALRGLAVRPFRFAGKQYLQIAAAGVAAGAAERFTPSSPPASWLERTGRYRITVGGSAGVRRNLSELELAYDRRLELLLFRFRLAGQRMSFPLEVLDTNTAVLAGTGTGLGETLSWAEGPPVGTLHWSGLTLTRED